MDDLRKLEEIFSRFPGIGPRQARRFVYHILNKSESSVRELMQLLNNVKKSTKECKKCRRFFTETNINDSDICGICGDRTRLDSMLMVVARDSDFEAIEKSGAYKGQYFILGGTVPILDKEPERRIRLKALLDRIRDDLNSKNLALNEIVLSMNTNPEGENTLELLKNTIKDEIVHKINKSIKISVLGKGLSTGAEIEYVDSDTIKNALKNRF